MNTPLIAIIGLPNSGKSTLFNKILHQKKALTYPEAGTTRDRHYATTSWNGRDFILIDTAGIARAKSDLEHNIQKQTEIAIDEADLILFVVDGKTNVSAKELNVAKQLNRARKKVVLAANKIDVQNPKTQTQASQFVKLGLGQPFLTSAVNGSGLGDLLDEIVKKLNVNSQQSTVNSQAPRIAFIGKPNVGKSSLINALLKTERLLVHEKAGTTRSSVDVPFEYNNQKFLLLDTAGIKKKWKQDADVEAAATVQSLRVLTQTDVVLFVLDGQEWPNNVDQAISQNILESKKTIVVLINKIDLLTKDQQQKMLDVLPDFFPQLWWAPVVFTSAKTAQGLDLVLKFAQEGFTKSQNRIPQENLDAFLDHMLQTNMPGKMADQRAPKLYNLKQVAVNPPTFQVTVNFPAALANAWKRLFEKQFRLKFGFEGTPIVINYIQKH